MARQLKCANAARPRFLPARQPLVALFRESLKSFYDQLDNMTPREAEGRESSPSSILPTPPSKDEWTATGVNLACVVGLRRHVGDNLLAPAGDAP